MSNNHNGNTSPEQVLGTLTVIANKRRTRPQLERTPLLFAQFAPAVPDALIGVAYVRKDAWATPNHLYFQFELMTPNGSARGVPYTEMLADVVHDLIARATEQGWED